MRFHVGCVTETPTACSRPFIFSTAWQRFAQGHAWLMYRWYRPAAGGCGPPGSSDPRKLEAFRANAPSSVTASTALPDTEASIRAAGPLAGCRGPGGPTSPTTPLAVAVRRVPTPEMTASRA